MATFREHDPLLELLQSEHGRLLERLNRGLNADGDRHDLGEIRRLLRSLAVAEDEVFYPMFERVSLRPETQRLLDDCRDHRTQQLEALLTLSRTRRSHPLWKLRALQLRELVQSHAEQEETGLLPVLRSQLPRALYRSLASAFAARQARGTHETAAAQAAPAPRASL